MPTVRVNDIDIYYERRGTGEPLLWVGGLGSNVAEIPYLIDSYSRHTDFIAYDGRGNGRTSAPEGAYSIAAFADDAAALLDALGIEDAHVYGSSMGGMVAQELVLRHPQRVRSLILGCTTAGAVRGVQPAIETVQKMIANMALQGDAALEAGWSLGYSQGYIEANREAMLARSRASSQHPAPGDSYMRQIVASAQHDTYDRLAQVTCPVMIIHGDADVMIPVGNAHLLKDGMPHAELHVLADMGHGYNLEAQAAADALVVGFVGRHARARQDVARAG